MTVTLPVRAAAVAVFAAFLSSGFAFATWAARIPTVKDQLHLDARQLGLLLLALPAGSLASLLASGAVVGALGPRRAVAASSLTGATGLGLAGLGSESSVALTVTGLAVYGLATGIWDVAMNVEAAAVEQRAGRSIMSRFHASLSAGTVLGAAAGAGCAALGVPVGPHLVAVALLVAVAVPVSTRRYLAAGPPSPGPRAKARRAWTEPRTLALGLFVLTAGFSEGTGNDWLASAMVEGHRTSVAAGSLSFALFVAAMTLGRWFGPSLVDRWGPRRVTRVGGTIALAGLVTTVFGPHWTWALAGVVAWGLGTAMGFPLGISAAAGDPGRAAARVGVVSTIGYTAFLAGPPLLGFVADHVGILRSLTITAAVVAVGLLLTSALPGTKAGAARPGSR
ncbi:MFS transporter [Cryptosporangium phraense]|uniref:MFS transporter n=1 Tax=Cryptosporangium phraense TaxID=2593070 RepID=A0A545AP41_9ACTN|nr:MFS transporter [Cryptosporangium phraense]TQS43092.1 MFS transporter [Cryptosporangium phraense]